MMNFVWIDDNPQREKVSKLLADELNVKIIFYNVDKKKIDNIVKDLLSEDEPDLVIIDHSLTHAYTETFKTGSTVSLFIREKWKNCPIISVSAVNLTELDSRLKSAYDIMIPENKISQYYELIKSLSRDYKKISAKRPNNILELIALFNPDIDDKDSLKQIFPHELKDDFDNSSYISNVFKWCNDVFFVRPGYLYNKQWAATFLGLSDKGFDSIIDTFEEAKYDGVFTDDSNPLWWKTKLLKVLNSKTEGIGLPWSIGRELVKKNNANYSKCYVTKELYPETVASLDETKDSEWKPMKLKVTEPHPSYENMLFFEELRIMKPAE